MLERIGAGKVAGDGPGLLGPEATVGAGAGLAVAETGIDCGSPLGAGRASGGWAAGGALAAGTPVGWIGAALGDELDRIASSACNADAVANVKATIAATSPNDL